MAVYILIEPLEKQKTNRCTTLNIVQKKGNKNNIFIRVSLNRIWRCQFGNSAEVLLYLFTSFLFIYFLFASFFSLSFLWFKENFVEILFFHPVYFVFHPTDILCEKNNWTEEEDICNVTDTLLPKMFLCAHVFVCCIKCAKDIKTIQANKYGEGCSSEWKVVQFYRTDSRSNNNMKIWTFLLNCLR